MKSDIKLLIRGARKFLVIIAVAVVFLLFAPGRVNGGSGCDWCTEDWVQFASHIVSGEAAATHGARMVTACALMHDVRRGGIDPFGLRARWYGWREPRSYHVDAVYTALNGGCEAYPQCRFVGTVDDFAKWRAWGLAGDFAYLWMDDLGQTTVCVPWEGENEREERQNYVYGGVCGARRYHGPCQ